MLKSLSPHIQNKTLLIDSKVLDTVTEWSKKGPQDYSLLEAWTKLPESTFKIPKKNRVEQMKEHEREADEKGSAIQSILDVRNSSLDRNFSFQKTPRPRPKDPFSHLSKEERRIKFEELVKKRELEKQQQARCYKCPLF